MDDCEYSTEIIIVPLKERITRNNFFGNKHTTADRITQTLMTASSSVKIHSTLQRWMTAILSVTKQIHYFKGWMAVIRMVK